MKQKYVLLGAFFTFILLVSTVTALPYTNSQPLMETIEEIEEYQIMNIYDVEINQFLQSKGIFDWIVQILLAILHLIQEIIQLVLELLQIVNLIEMIISAITQLINVVFQLIEAIMDLISPDMTIYT